jgi:hypothetical protein
MPNGPAIAERLILRAIEFMEREGEVELANAEALKALIVDGGLLPAPESAEEVVQGALLDNELGARRRLDQTELDAMRILELAHNVALRENDVAAARAVHTASLILLARWTKYVERYPPT